MPVELLFFKQEQKTLSRYGQCLNDSVTTKFSAHTNDRLKYVYTNASLLDDAGTSAVEYYIFDNVYPAH